MMGWREIMGVQAKAIYPQNPQKSEPRRGSEDCESSERAPGRTDPPTGPAKSVAADWRTVIALKRPPPAPPGKRAEAVAHERRLAEWLNANPASSAPDRCAGCGGPDAPGAALIPFGIDALTWLHSDCWLAWYNKRLAEAGTACSVPP